MANGYARLNYETNDVGNEVVNATSSTKMIFPPLMEFGVDPGVSHLERDDELRQTDEPLQPLPEMYAPTWSLLSRMYPDLMGFVLKWAFGPPVSTAGNGVITDPDGNTIPTGAHRHVFASDNANWGDGVTNANPPTVAGKVAYSDESTFFDLKGAAISELSLDMPDSGGGRISASGPACFLGKIANPSLTPSFESLAVPPFMRRDLAVVTWLSGTAVSEDWGVQASCPVEALRTLGISSAYPDDMEKGSEPIVVSGSIRKRAIATQDWDALIAATRFAIKCRWSSQAIVAGSYPYRMWLEGDGAQYMGGGPSSLSNARRRGAEFNWKLTSDGVGAAATWTIVNATASYA